MAKSVGLRISHLVDDADLVIVKLENLYHGVYNIKDDTDQYNLGQVLVLLRDDVIDIKSELQSLRRVTI